MKKIESLEVKEKKESLTKFQKEILKNVGCDSIETLEEMLEISDPDSDTTETLELVLAELKGSGTKAKKKSTVSRIEELYEGISSEGISDKGSGAEKEATEYFEAVGREIQREEEAEKAKEGQPLTKEEAPWVFKKDANELKTAIGKVWDEIKKLFD